MKRIIYMMHVGIKQRVFFFITVLLLFNGAFAQNYKVGALYPLSGPLAALGNESFRGLELAVEEINAKGGIKGQPIVIVRADALDPNQAISEARRLTSIEKVSVIFGTFASTLSYAATQVTELAGIPYLEMGAIADSITERGYRYIFRSNPTAAMMAEAIIESVIEVVAPGLKVAPESLRVAIIHEDGNYGVSVAENQQRIAKEKGLNIVEVLPYSAKTVDMSGLILRLKGAQVDVVLQVSYQNDTILYFNQAKAAGFSAKANIGAGGGYSLVDTEQALQGAMNGAFDVDFPQILMDEKGAPGVAQFVASYQQKYNALPSSGHSLTNYVGAKIFLDILATAASDDKDVVRETMLNYKRPSGSTASGWGVDFGDDGQNRLSRYNLMQWQNGQLVTIYPKEMAISTPAFTP